MDARNAPRQLAPCPQVLICPPPSDGHFTPSPEQGDYPANEGWQWQEEIQAWAECPMSCHPLDSNTKGKQNRPNPQQQDSPVPCMPCKQTPQPPTPGPSGTQWLEDLFYEPSQHNESPIPGSSQPSEPHEDTLTCGPEPEVAPMQSMEEPLACLATPDSVIISDNTPIGSPPVPLPPLLPWFLPQRSLPVPSSPHSHNVAWQEFTNLGLALMIP
ncbi:hypothetical protein O181_038087 [Austropuccinia psidii MF-1]|uniref:Uncharacterized protein n=1 Tax=Austropuccinia psidii MF-1 TaxID=1389203 RepID=A0A9Q3HBK0_9BASI|nr:hypothetical protein [Austropuccinia psidii MF-1]